MPLPAVPKNCAVYTRQSTKSESDLTSIQVQRETCEDFIRSQGPAAFRVLKEHFDDDRLTGANLDRPALQRLIKLVEAGQVQAVVVHRLDRLSRRLVDCSWLVETFKEHKVQLIIAAMPEIGGRAFDSLILHMLASFAEFEREMIAERIADTRAGLIARGRRIAGEVPFGYSAEPRNKQLVPVESEAAIVREVFRLVGEGVRPSAIEKIAAKKGWRTRKGKPWTARQVLEVVSNPTYMGRFRNATGTRPGVHPAIVSEDLFQRCATVIASRRSRPARPRVRRVWSVLQRKVRCARCGQLMGIHTNVRGCVRSLSFRCRRTAAGEKACVGTSIPVFDVENAVEAILRNPSEHLPLQRGRPPRWLAALHLLGQIFPTLDVAARRKVLKETVQEVVWNAESSRMRVSFRKEALAQYLKERPPAAPRVTMRVCKPARAYRR